jgi:hypothetical protein
MIEALIEDWKKKRREEGKNICRALKNKVRWSR